MTLKPIEPTPEQRKIFFLNPYHPVLLSGRAGSGKTTTAVLRAKQLLCFYERRGIPNPRVGFFVFNKTLKHYLDTLAAQELAPYQYDVMTLDQWCLDFLDQNALRQEAIATDKQREVILQQAIQFVQLRDRHPDIARLGEGFLIDEIDYLLGRFGLDIDRYIRSKREGRGDNPEINDDIKRIIAQELIPNYQLLLKSSNLIDWNQLRDRTLSNIQTMSYQRYPILIVDEAQDLSALQIRITIKMVSLETKSLTFIRDSTQRIYKANYIWKDIGLTFGAGNKLCLEKNYRNTKAIAEVAASLMQHEPDQSDIDILDPSLTIKHGPKPTWVQGRYTQQKQYLVEKLQELDTTQDSIGILHIQRNEVSHLATYIRNNGLDCIVLLADEDSTNIRSTQGIGISTLHSAKGLEFDHVFIVGYDDFFAPGPNRILHRTTSAHITAHRKLLYTAITRAQKTLTITSSLQEYSRFLKEIPQKLLEIVRV